MYNVALILKQLKIVMRILVDADACPKVIKELLYRTSKRVQIELILFANHFFQIPISPLIKLIKVPAGFDEADRQIAGATKPNDIVITADIPLADAVIKNGGIALNPRGTLYTQENIKQTLVMRNIMEQMRDNQLVSGGPKTFNKLDIQALANQLDKLLTANKLTKF
jgi:uncharacterized protein